MRATVIDNGDTSDSFPVTNVVKEGCVLGPTVFSMIFAAVLHDASQDNDDGIQLKYRTHGDVFNLERLKAESKVKVAPLRELLFADDCALNSSIEAEVQQCVNHFSRACDNFVLPSSPRRQKQEQQKQTGSRRLRKCSLLTKRDFTLPPAPQPARHTNAPSVEECCRPELD